MTQKASVVDHHVHYDYNGFNPYFLLTKAKHLGIKSMAIMGHDVVNSKVIAECIQIGKEKGIHVFSGVETVGLLKNGSLVELIGIGFDPKHPAIFDWMDVSSEQKQRAKKCEWIVEQLKSLGFSFESLEEIQQQNLQKFLQGSLIPMGISISRIAVSNKQNTSLIKNLMQKHNDIWKECQMHYGQLSDEEFAAKFLYWLYFAKDKSLNKGSHITVKEAVERIHMAGGIALYSPEGSFDNLIWSELQDCDIDGLMAWHGSKFCWSPVSPEMDIPTNVALDAMHKGLVLTGGSDFQANTWKLGFGVGDLDIPYFAHERVICRIKLIRRLFDYQQAD